MHAAPTSRLSESGNVIVHDFRRSAAQPAPQVAGDHIAEVSTWFLKRIQAHPSTGHFSGGERTAPADPSGTAAFPIVLKRAEATASGARGSLAPWQARRIAAFIDAEIGTPLKVSQLAGLVRLSASYFQRAFRKSFGVAPHAYVLNRRVAAAQEQMLSSHTPLAQIALDCGFADQAHLCRVFRRATGSSPAHWRRSHLT
jgi:AraC-like DNA-binding protein